MKRQNLNNEELDLIGGRLLKAMDLSDADIETIVAAPQLLASIKAEIGADRSRERRMGWLKLASLNWQITGASLAASALFAAFTFFEFANQDQSTADPSRGYQPPMATANIPPTRKVASGRSEFDGSRTPAIESRTSVRQSAKSKLLVKTRSIKRVPRPATEEVGEFYAVTYTGSLEESEKDGQIVRVELPRASLFAMGIIVPVENEKNGSVKADLLIGEDGVMKAVRLVN